MCSTLTLKGYFSWKTQSINSQDPSAAFLINSPTVDQVPYLSNQGIIPLHQIFPCQIKWRSFLSKTGKLCRHQWVTLYPLFILHRFIVFKLLMGAGMIVYGLFHKPKPYQKLKISDPIPNCTESATTTKTETLFSEHPCYNGAAGWMFKAGILELVATSKS